MDCQDFEICERGQDGIQYHAMIYFCRDRVCMVSGYDHDGAGKNQVWEPVFFDDAFKTARVA